MYHGASKRCRAHAKRASSSNQRAGTMARIENHTSATICSRSWSGQPCGQVVKGGKQFASPRSPSSATAPAVGFGYARRVKCRWRFPSDDVSAQEPGQRFAEERSLFYAVKGRTAPPGCTCQPRCRCTGVIAAAECARCSNARRAQRARQELRLAQSSTCACDMDALEKLRLRTHCGEARQERRRDRGLVMTEKQSR